MQEFVPTLDISMDKLLGIMGKILSGQVPEARVHICTTKHEHYEKCRDAHSKNIDGADASSSLSSVASKSHMDVSLVHLIESFFPFRWSFQLNPLHEPANTNFLRQQLYLPLLYSLPILHSLSLKGLSNIGDKPVEIINVLEAHDSAIRDTDLSATIPYAHLIPRILKKVTTPLKGYKINVAKENLCLADTGISESVSSVAAEQMDAISPSKTAPEVVYPRWGSTTQLLFTQITKQLIPEDSVLTFHSKVSRNTSKRKQSLKVSQDLLGIKKKRYK